MNEDEMTELDVSAGDELARTLDRYARLRLDPSAGQAKRARTAVMEAAWRQRLAAPAGDAAEGTGTVGRTTMPAGGAGAGTHGLFPRWSARRVGVSFAAAVLAGLLVGTTAFAGSRAGGPLYDARVALEELTLPADPQARLEAELALAQGRLAEIVEAAAKDDPAAVAAAADAYVRSLDDLDGATGGPADRALVAVELHREILIQVLGRAPEAAHAGLEHALARSTIVLEHLGDAGTRPAGGATNGGANGGNGGNGTTGGNGGKAGDGSGGNGGNGGGNGTTGGNGSGGGNGGNAGGQGGGHEGGKPAHTAAPGANASAAPAPARTPSQAPVAPSPVAPSPGGGAAGPERVTGGKP